MRISAFGLVALKHLFPSAELVQLPVPPMPLPPELNVVQEVRSIFPPPPPPPYHAEDPVMLTCTPGPPLLWACSVEAVGGDPPVPPPPPPNHVFALPSPPLYPPTTFEAPLKNVDDWVAVPATKEPFVLSKDPPPPLPPGNPP